MLARCMKSGLVLNSRSFARHYVDSQTIDLIP